MGGRANRRCGGQQRKCEGVRTSHEIPFAGSAAEMKKRLAVNPRRRHCLLPGLPGPDGLMGVGSALIP
jgi:hypothetical protein